MNPETSREKKGLFGRALGSLVPLAPKSVVGHFARRYIAGETLEEAIQTARELSIEGCAVTFDSLGEEVDSEKDVQLVLDNHLELLETLSGETYDRTISVKLTAFGLRLDPELAKKNLLAIVERAEKYGQFVRIDMEDATLTDETLDLYREIRQTHQNLGIVLQAKLRRTLNDIESLMPFGPNVRIVKGAYAESPDIAFQGQQEIRDNYVEAVEKLFDQGNYVAIATHDEELVDRSLKLIDSKVVRRGHFEFQMLYGIKPELRAKLVESGYRVRVYLPYGKDWYAYSLRRVQENPSMLKHVMGNVF